MDSNGIPAIVNTALTLEFGHEPPFSAIELSAVESLTLSFGSLPDLGVLTPFSSLCILTLSSIELRSPVVSDAGGFLENVFRLRCESCRGLDELQFSSFSGLTRLSAQNCGVLGRGEGFVQMCVELKEVDLRGNPLEPLTYHALQDVMHCRLSTPGDWEITRHFFESGLELSFDAGTLYRPYDEEWARRRPECELKQHWLERVWVEEMLERGDWTTETFWDAVRARYEEEERIRVRTAVPAFSARDHTFRVSAEEALARVERSSLSARAKESVSSLIERMSGLEFKYVDEAYLDEFERKARCTLQKELRELFKVFTGMVPNTLEFFPEHEPEEVKAEELMLWLTTGQLLTHEGALSECAEYRCLRVASLSGEYIYVVDVDSPTLTPVGMLFNEFVVDWRSNTIPVFDDIFAFFDAIMRPISLPRLG